MNSYMRGENNFPVAAKAAAEHEYYRSGSRPDVP
jgi:hypothetical protein